MNLIFSLPLGVLLILGGFAVLYKLMRIGLYTSAVVMVLVTILVYGVVVSLNWPGADVFAIHIAVYLMSIYAVTVITGSLSGTSRWHWGPALIIGFFVVVIMVDAVFIFLAQSGLSTEWAQRLLPAPSSTEQVQSKFPGTVSHDYREKGEQFNEYQQQRLEQIRQGWQTRIGWDQPAVAGETNRLLLEVTDAQGHPLDNASVQVRMLYPGDASQDLEFSMSPQQPGRYEYELSVPAAGRWDVVVQIRYDSAQHEIRSATVVQ